MTEQEIQDSLEPVVTDKKENTETVESFINKIITKQLSNEDIPDDVCKEYLRCILGSKPFELTLNLFEGDVKITFTEGQYRITTKYQKVLDKINTHDPFIAAKLATIVYTKEVKVQNTVYSGLLDVKEEWLSADKSAEDISADIEEVYAQCFGALNESIHRFLPILWAGFNQLLTLLIKRGLPNSF